jgi:MFS family permease
MIVRFCLYSVLKNLRFFEPFFLLYLLAGPEHGGPSLSYLEIGALVGFQKLLTGILESPTGVMADRFGRRRALAACFLAYVVAFPLYAWASTSRDPLLILYGAQAVFGVGEALRTGTHKAIMLDWVDESGRDDHTRVIGLTRLFSKSSAGIAAISGGIILYATASFTLLFWAATVPALLGVFLAFTYPRWLEGDSSRAPKRDRPGLRESLRRLQGKAGMFLLFGQSVVFESQIKLSQHYLQPYLDTGLKQNAVQVVGGVGAIFIGGYYLVQDVLAGLASAASARAEKALGVRRLTLIHAVSVAVILAVAGCLVMGWFVAGAAGFVVLALLQNLRRPMFISALNQLMDKAQRTTTLSLESQGRSLAYAVGAPLTGWSADRWGLEVALAAAGAVMIIGVFLNPPAGGHGEG